MALLENTDLGRKHKEHQISKLKTFIVDDLYLLTAFDNLTIGSKKKVKVIPTYSYYIATKCNGEYFDVFSNALIKVVTEDSENIADTLENVIEETPEYVKSIYRFTGSSIPINLHRIDSVVPLKSISDNHVKEVSIQELFWLMNDLNTEEKFNLLTLDYDDLNERKKSKVKTKKKKHKKHTK